MNNLCSQYEEKVRPCIDLIDSLRALGVEQDLALPAIAVIGDQSSGKSSVLEALSGVALPRGSGESSMPIALLGCGPGTSRVETGPRTVWRHSKINVIFKVIFLFGLWCSLIAPSSSHKGQSLRFHPCSFLRPPSAYITSFELCTQQSHSKCWG